MSTIKHAAAEDGPLEALFASALGADTESHPSAAALEGWSAGDGEDGIAEHLALCVRCQRLVSKLEAERNALLEREPPERFVRRIQQRAELARRAQAPQRENFWWSAFRIGVPVLAAGFVLVFYVGSSLLPSAPGDGVEADRMEGTAPDLVRKGGARLAVIRERAGAQSVASGVVAVAPGDLLRVRFELEARERVSAGILTDAGDWVPFFDGDFAPGAHTPQATLRVDAEPVSGTLLFGATAAVEAARQGGSRAGVQTIELRWSAPP